MVLVDKEDNIKDSVVLQQLHKDIMAASCSKNQKDHNQSCTNVDDKMAVIIDGQNQLCFDEVALNLKEAMQKNLE
ncbi:hypothetical protein ACOSQ2_002659 [Xanthoceras sorbifolium]